MSIFPKFGDFDNEDRYLQSMMEETYAQAITLNISYWAEADMDARFVAGDQTLWNELYGNLPAARRKQFNFNRIRRVVNMISGYQRQHQKSLQVIPRESEDQITADQFTKLLYWANTVSNINEHVSEAFEAAIKTGLSMAQVWWDYREDPINGTPKIDVLHYNDFLIDPYYRQKDLSDCNYIWTRKWMTKQDAMSLLPQHVDEISQMEPIGWTTDGKFQYQPEAYNYGAQNLLTYDEYYYKTYRECKSLVDKVSGDTLEWTGNEEQLKILLKRYPHIDVVDRIIPTVKVGILLNGRKMFHGNVPTGDQYPFVGFYSYYEPQIPYYPVRVQGVVRGLRDSQYLYNRRKIIELDILESVATSGWKYKADALVDPKSVFLTGQGRGIAVKDDANLDDVQQIQPPQVPPSMIELSRQLGDEIQQISGVNEELLGSAQDDKAGILSMLRQGAGLVTLQTMFDQLDNSFKRIGKLLIQGFQHNFTAGKVKRIINEMPSAQFMDRYFSTYDCQVEEAALTTTQKQLQFQQMLYLREVGVPIPTTELIKASQLTNKDDLIKSIMEQEQQQAELASVQAQTENEVRQATIQSLMSRAQADQGLAVERASRVNENAMLAVERGAQAEKDRADAAYEKVKAMKELEDMDLNYIAQGLQLIEQIKSFNSQETMAAQPQPNLQNTNL